MFSTEYIASNIGFADYLLRQPKINASAIKKAEQEADRGRHTAGTAAFFRHSMAQTIDQSRPRFRSAFDAAVKNTPIVVDDKNRYTQEMDTLSNILLDELSVGRRFSAIPNEVNEIHNVTHELDQNIEGHLQQSDALQGDRPAEIVHLLWDTQMTLSILLGLEARAAAGVSMKGRMVGLPVLLLNNVSKSIAALQLRRLLRKIPKLAFAVEDFEKNQYRVPGILPEKVDIMLEEAKKAKGRLTVGAVDAKSHLLLGKALELTAGTCWENTIGELPDGEMGLISSKPMGDFVYSYQRSDQQTLREMVEIDTDHTTKLSTDDSEPFPMFISSKGNLCIIESCQFAGLSPELLPDNSVKQMKDILEGSRSGIIRLMQAQPLIRKNLASLGRPVARIVDRDTHYIVIDKKYSDLAEGLLMDIRHRDKDKGPFMDGFLVGKSKPLSKSENAPLPLEPEAMTIRDLLSETERGHLLFSELVVLLAQLGIEKETGKGSHTKYTNPVADRFCILSNRYTRTHNTEIPIGIVRDSLEDLHLSEEQMKMLESALEKL